MNSITINSQEVNFKVVDKSIYINSLDVARVFEKKHTNILRDIRRLPSDDFSQRNFASADYIDLQGKSRPCYNLTRDGFALLAMGFTGKAAYQWKVAFIDGFNKMEQEIRESKEQKDIDTAYTKESFDNLLNALRAISFDLDELKSEHKIVKDKNNELKDELLADKRELLEFYKNQTQKPSILQNRFLTESEKQKIREHRRKGLSYYAIGKALNRDHCTISRFIKRDSLFDDFTKKIFKKSPNQGGLL